MMKDYIFATLAMVSGLIAMLIGNYAGAYVLFVIVLLWLICLMVEAINQDKRKRENQQELKQSEVCTECIKDMSESYKQWYKFGYGNGYNDRDDNKPFDNEF